MKTLLLLLLPCTLFCQNWPPQPATFELITPTAAGQPLAAPHSSTFILSTSSPGPHARALTVKLSHTIPFESIELWLIPIPNSPNWTPAADSIQITTTSTPFAQLLPQLADQPCLFEYQLRLRITAANYGQLHATQLLGQLYFEWLIE